MAAPSGVDNFCADLRAPLGPFDVFINICDGAWDEDRAGIEVVQTLERLGAAFTGANSGFFEHRLRARRVSLPARRDLQALRPQVGGLRANDLDYATFFADGLDPFTCHCGASQCRGVIRGDDYLLPFLGDRYGGHISDYVRRKRLAHNR